MKSSCPSMEYSWPEENVTGLPSLLTRRYVKLATENVVTSVDVYNEKLVVKPNLLFFTLKCSPIEEKRDPWIPADFSESVCSYLRWYIGMMWYDEHKFSRLSNCHWKNSYKQEWPHQRWIFFFSVFAIMIQSGIEISVALWVRWCSSSHRMNTLPLMMIFQWD